MVDIGLYKDIYEAGYRWLILAYTKISMRQDIDGYIVDIGLGPWY